MDWAALAAAATPVVVLVITFLMERRPSVRAYYSNISSFTIRGADGAPGRVINHHTVVVLNGGRKAATNVRLRHRVLPEHVDISPNVEHTGRANNPGGEIVIPRLRPKEYVQVAYMYGPELDYTRINDGVVHDEGFAKQINVVHQRQFPAWFLRLSGLFWLAGLMLTVYWLVRLGFWAWALLQSGAGRAATGGMT